MSEPDPAPLTGLRLLAGADDAVCVDGVCAVPGPAAGPAVPHAVPPPSTQRPAGTS